MRFATALRSVTTNRVQSQVHRPIISHNRIVFAASIGGYDRFAQTSNSRCNHHNNSNNNTPQIIRHYGSRTNVELEKEPMSGTKLIQPYMRSCLSSDEATKEKGMDMEFAVSFLGTGGGSPTNHRNGSCTALRLGGQSFLFDVSEGTTRQMDFSRIMPSTVTKIFISHLHGDHLYGIVPVLLTIGTTHKIMQQDPQRKSKHNVDHNGQKPTLEIYGPPGVYNYICMVMKLSCSKMNYLEVKVTELVGGKQERGPTPNKGNQPRGRRNVFLSHYPEIEMPNITRRYLAQNEDNVWIIDEPEPITEDTIINLTKKVNGFSRLPNDINLGLERRLHIKAAELDHVRGVQTFGYTVEEQPPPGTIDMEKARALGLKPSKKLGLLKCGLSVSSDDGSGEMIHPHQVITKSFRPRKFVFLADHRLVLPPMASLCKNADVVVHEATLSKRDGEMKMKVRGHTTAYNAGLFGKHMRSNVVAMNHFGSSSVGKEHVENMVAEARWGNQQASQVIATHDFMEIYVPRGGYDFSSSTVSESIENTQSERSNGIDEMIDQPSTSRSTKQKQSSIGLVNEIATNKQSERSNGTENMIEKPSFSRLLRENEKRMSSSTACKESENLSDTRERIESSFSKLVKG